MASKDALEKFWDVVDRKFELAQENNVGSEVRLDFLEEYVAIVVDGRIVETFKNPYNE